IARVHADRIAVNAADRFTGNFIAEAPPGIAEDELICSQRNRLTKISRPDSIRQRRRRGIGGLLWRGAKDCLAHLIDPLIVGSAISRSAAQQMILFEHSWKNRSRLIQPGAVAVGFSLHAIMHRLPKQGMRLLASDQPQKIPRAIGKDDAVNFG